MPRILRSELPDGLFHVTSRGNRQQPIFATDGDRRLFLALLTRMATRESWRVLGYSLLDNHYHLLVETSASRLSTGMRRLNGAYAQAFNSFHGLGGHLFQGRFYSGVVEAQGHLTELIRYLAWNPVRAGLCAVPAGWRWSSYPALIGRCPPEKCLCVQEVLRLFSRNDENARRLLEDYVLDARPH